jgi:hypothetical protein
VRVRRPDRQDERRASRRLGRSADERGERVFALAAQAQDILQDEPMPHAHEDDLSIKGDAVLIAAQAKSLRGTMLRDRPPNLPVSAGELADAVELIELLADSMADLAALVEEHPK